MTKFGHTVSYIIFLSIFIIVKSNAVNNNTQKATQTKFRKSEIYLSYNNGLNSQNFSRKSRNMIYNKSMASSKKHLQLHNTLPHYLPIAKTKILKFSQKYDERLLFKYFSR